MTECQDGAKARMLCAIASGARPALASNEFQSPAVEILPLGSGTPKPKTGGRADQLARAAMTAACNPPRRICSSTVTISR
jgi:hypothetical protein